MNHEKITLTIPVWGLFSMVAGFVGTAITVIVGVLISNHDLRSTLTRLDATTNQLSEQVKGLQESSSNLRGLPKMIDQDRERADKAHSALMNRIERLEGRVFRQ